MNDLCTILINTCDSYEDCWNPFFTLLKKYWKNIKYPIILNTESKSFKFEGMNIETLNLFNENEKIEWGNRMIKTLKRIDSKYIIFLLDDFFICDYIKEDKLDEVINWMENDESVAVFSFNIVEKSKYEDITSIKYDGYALRNKKGPYRFNCQAAVWRKDILIKTFRKFENPWEWETIGNFRSRRIKQKFYTLVNQKNMIFKYDCENIGLSGAKWKMPDTKDFFDKEGLQIDYSVRNDKNKNVKNTKKRTIYVKISDRLKKYLKKVRSSI